MFVQTDTNQLGHHYRLWAGLIALYNKDYQIARAHFEAIRVLGFENNRVREYRMQSIDGLMFHD